MSIFTIFNNKIGHVYTEKKNINGVKGITYYFTRKTVTENLPIEISFVKFNNDIFAVSKHSTNVALDEYKINDKDTYIYNNDIAFDKTLIENELDQIEEETVENNLAETFNTLFGIDISSINGIEGFEFNKMVYIDRLDMDFNFSDYFEGYMIILHDIATKSLKLGIFVGRLKPYTYRDFLDEVTSVGKNKILDKVRVENTSDKTIVTNENKYKVKIELEKYRYKIYRSIYPDKHYEKEIVDTLEFVMDPGEELIFYHEKNQTPKSYTLLNNPINPPEGKIYVSDEDAYTEALPYIKETPFKISLKSIMSPIGANDPEQFYIVSSLYNIFKDRNSFPHAILEDSYDYGNLEIKGEFGSIFISDNDKVKKIITNGGSDTFIEKARVLFKAKLRKIYSALGEDIFNANIDYMLANGDIRILSMESTIAYNDTISTPLQALNLNFGFFANYNEIMYKNNHLEYKNSIYLDNSVCSHKVEETIKKLMGTDAFKNDYIEFNVNDVLKFPSKKLYSGTLFRTYNPEIDDAYSFYQKTVSKEISGYSLLNIPMVIGSEEVASVEPILDIRGDNSCRETFAYDVDEDIGALGLEISLENVLKKLKKISYIYAPERELAASFNLGITFDGEWYYCGEDFFPSDSIENDTFTTYLDNEVVSLSKNNNTPFRHIYDKKEFFDSDDFGSASYKQKLHDAFRALVIGDIDSSKTYDNPGLKYIVDHLMDRNIKRHFSYDEMLLNAYDVVYRSSTKSLSNTLVMPNIFEQLLNDKKLGYSQYVGNNNDHTIGKMREDYKINYADLKINDAYDSAYKIGHTFNILFNKDNLKLAKSLFNKIGKVIFGINFGEFTITDSISVKKKRNYFYDGIMFPFAVVFYKNDEEIFAIAYDYRTKELKINNSGNLQIVDFALLMTAFDIFLHDYYKYLDGKKRVSLGVYDFEETSDETKGLLSKEYLLMNGGVESEKPRYNVFAVRVGGYDAYLYAEMNQGPVSEVMLWDYKGKPVSMSVELNSSSLVVNKAEESTIIPVSKLERYPGNRLIENGLSIEIYRTKLFLPNQYFGESLKTARIEIVDVDSKDTTIRNMIGDIKVIAFGDHKKFHNGYGHTYDFIYDGEGLKFWKHLDGYSTDIETIEDVGNILQHKGEERLYNVDILQCKITFE